MVEDPKTRVSDVFGPIKCQLVEVKTIILKIYVIKNTVKNPMVCDLEAEHLQWTRSFSYCSTFINLSC